MGGVEVELGGGVGKWGDMRSVNGEIGKKNFSRNFRQRFLENIDRRN